MMRASEEFQFTLLRRFECMRASVLSLKLQVRYISRLFDLHGGPHSSLATEAISIYPYCTSTVSQVRAGRD